MKVLYLGLKEWPCGSSKNFDVIGPVGVDIYTHNLIDNLKSEDVEIFVMSRKFPNQRSQEVQNGIRIKRYPFFDGLYLTLLTMFIFSFFYGISLVRREKIDIIHGHDFFGILPAYLIAKITSTKVIGTSHGYYLRTPTTSFFQHIVRTFLTKTLMKKVYYNLDKWIFLNENELFKFEEIIGSKPKNSIIIYNGVKVPMELDASKREKNYILFVGRLVPEKSIDNLILAMSLLKNKKNLSLNIVGDGFQMDYLRKLTKENNLSEVVKFHGWQKNLKSYYEKAFVFALPSYIEGAPSALYEAMSFGIPSVIGNLDLAPDDSVLKCKYNTPEEISKKILCILENPELRLNLSEKSRSVASRYFNRENMGDEHLKLYQNVIN